MLISLKRWTRSLWILGFHRIVRLYSLVFLLIKYLPTYTKFLALIPRTRSFSKNLRCIEILPPFSSLLSQCCHVFLVLVFYLYLWLIRIPTTYILLQLFYTFPFLTILYFSMLWQRWIHAFFFAPVCISQWSKSSVFNLPLGRKCANYCGMIETTTRPRAVYRTR